MQHSGRQLLTPLVDYLEGDASQPTVDRQLEGAWRWLLDALMPAIRREGNRTDFDHVLIGGQRRSDGEDTCGAGRQSQP